MACSQVNIDISHSPNTQILNMQMAFVAGMKVFAVGYGVFGAEHNLAPSVTSGVISKVLHFKHIPVMVQVGTREYFS